MKAPCAAAPIASLRFSRSMLVTFLGWARHAVGIPRGETAATKPAATVAAPRPSPLMTGPAGVIRAALLSLALLGGWTGSAAAVTCTTTIPCKKIWFFNNSNETLHPILFIGRRGVDEWLQAYTQASPAQRNTAKWPTTRDSRVYVNGKKGIPPRVP